MKKVLVLGGTGYLGSSVMSQLVGKSIVTSLARNAVKAERVVP